MQIRHVKIKLSIVDSVEIAIDEIKNPDFKRGEDDASRGIPFDQGNTIAWQTGWVAEQCRSNPKHARPVIMQGNSFNGAIESIRESLRSSR
jgi:hypothetical protein